MHGCCASVNLPGTVVVMPSKDMALGPTGKRVAATVAELRARLRLTKTELSQRLEVLGRPMSLDVLTKVEKGSRRVDADDLIALAIALEVNPNVLLAPLGDQGSAHLTGKIKASGKIFWPWLYGDEPLLQWNADGSDSTCGIEPNDTLNLDKVLAFTSLAKPYHDDRGEALDSLLRAMAARRGRGEPDGGR